MTSSWNPTRHEQREGRVDRYGQPSPKVRVITYYGLDNQIDGVVLDVLLRKHKKIRSSLGISVPVPVDTEQVVEAVFEGLLLRSRPGNEDELLLDFEEYFRPRKEDLFAKWDLSAEREKRSRTMFSQEGLSASVREVERDLAEVREAIGSSIDVAAFTKEALLAHGAVAEPEWRAQNRSGRNSERLARRAHSRPQPSCPIRAAHQVGRTAAHSHPPHR